MYHGEKAAHFVYFTVKDMVVLAIGEQKYEPEIDCSRAIDRTKYTILGCMSNDILLIFYFIISYKFCFYAGVRVQ